VTPYYQDLPVLSASTSHGSIASTRQSWRAGPGIDRLPSIQRRTVRSSTASACERARALSPVLSIAAAISSRSAIQGLGCRVGLCPPVDRSYYAGASHVTAPADRCIDHIEPARAVITRPSNNDEPGFRGVASHCALLIGVGLHRPDTLTIGPTVLTVKGSR
jgi:hypothetical protein